MHNKGSGEHIQILMSVKVLICTFYHIQRVVHQYLAVAENYINLIERKISMICTSNYFLYNTPRELLTN